MGTIHQFSDDVIDFAERLSDVADAVSGKGRRSSHGGTRWILLPAAGAALYALFRSDFFARQAKGVVDEAKSRAADLPNDLMNSVRQASSQPTNRNRRAGGSRANGRSRSTSSSGRTTRTRSSTSRSRKTKTAR
jgi:hypothetical protein